MNLLVIPHSLFLYQKVVRRIQAAFGLFRRDKSLRADLPTLTVLPSYLFLHLLMNRIGASLLDVVSPRWGLLVGVSPLGAC